MLVSRSLWRCWLTDLLQLRVGLPNLLNLSSYLKDIYFGRGACFTWNYSWAKKENAKKALFSNYILRRHMIKLIETSCSRSLGWRVSRVCGVSRWRRWSQWVVCAFRWMKTWVTFFKPRRVWGSVILCPLFSSTWLQICWLCWLRGQKNLGFFDGLVPHLVEDGLSIFQYANDTILFLDDD
jgi:hypothetical protein